METITYENIYSHNNYSKILFILFLIMILFYFLTIISKNN